MTNPTAPRKTVWGGVAAICVGLVILAVVAEIGLRIALSDWAAFDSGRFMTPIDVPGYGQLYIGTPGFDGDFAQNNGDFHVHIAVNAFGMRDPEPPEAADGRVWFLGDSMTFGWGVERDQTFGAVAARDAGTKMYLVASPGANVCGYEALLARIPRTAHPRAVVLGLVLENDLTMYDCPHGHAAAAPAAGGVDDVSWISFKHWLTGRSALYNVVAASIKRVPAVVDALEWLGVIAREQAYHINFDPAQYPAIVASTATEIAWLRTMLPAGTPFAVLIVPGRPELQNDDPTYTNIRKAMDAELAKRGIATIDPAPQFHAAGFHAVHFAHDGHWLPRGHEIAGKLIAAWLKSALPPR